MNMLYIVLLCFHRVHILGWIIHKVKRMDGCMTKATTVYSNGKFNASGLCSPTGVMCGMRYSIQHNIKRALLFETKLPIRCYCIHWKWTVYARITNRTLFSISLLYLLSENNNYFLHTNMARDLFQRTFNKTELKRKQHKNGGKKHDRN